MVDSNKPAVCEDDPLRFQGGRLRVVRMGDFDMEFCHAQGLGGTQSSDRGCRRLLWSTIDVANANHLTRSCNGPGCHGGVLDLVRGFWGAGNTCRFPQSVVDMMAEGAGGVRGQARVEKSTNCYHFACMMKEMMGEEENEQTEEFMVIYLLAGIEMVWSFALLGLLYRNGLN